jgi:V/A-type H+-transporting ATPase subunit I
MAGANRVLKVRISLPRRGLAKASAALQQLGCIHLIDYKDERADFRIDAPLPGADDISRQLVKVRGMVKALGISKESKGSVRSDSSVEAWLRGSMGEREREVSKVATERDGLEGRIADARSELATLGRLESLPPTVRFDLTSACTIVGVSKKGDVETAVQSEVSVTVSKARARKGWAYAFLCERKDEARLRHFLSALGFTVIDVPKFEGPVGERAGKLRTELPELAARQEAVKREIDRLRGELEGDLLAAEEYLSIRLDKLQAPLRFASTEHFTVIEGWVRGADVGRVQEAMARLDGVPTEVTALEPGVADSPPTVMDSPRPVKSFEFLQRMYSVPQGKEIDPTLILAFSFSLFFGLMVGDLGYGLLLIVLGYYLRDHKIFGIGGPAVSEIIMIGGAMAAIFGAFIFGEALGIPFHSVPDPVKYSWAPGGEVSWSSFLGLNIPVHALIEKTEYGGVIHFMILSVYAGFAHMLLGLVIGIYNARHNGKHAAARTGWMLLMFGFFLLVAKMTEHNDLGGRMCETFLFNLQSGAFNVTGIEIPHLSIPLLLAGLGFLMAAEGPLIVLEAFSMLSNIVSYVRLAAIGMAKGATAFSFNVMILPMVYGGGLMMPVGVLLFIGVLVFMLLLGALSSGIQALRLNYVEFFQKFYEGGGFIFSPFRIHRRYTKE